ncbi:MAG: efflux RND transporter periplasmic adaptor subunit [Verrucomicrobiales bacterium]|nr:efflux RND transporter periplasmic adaptor subunit [Verrucomicrobiales bacterium]
MNTACTFRQTARRWLSTVLLPLLGFCSCHQPPAEKAAGTTETARVAVQPVSTVTWDREVEIIGTLFPKDEATLGAEVEGSVEKTFVEFGQRVTAGQELAVIVSTTYAAQLQQAEASVGRAAAQLENARLNYDRALKVPDKGALAANELDKSRTSVAQWEAEVKAAESSVALARLNLEHCRIKAPFDGTIAQRIISKGDFVKIGAPLFDIVNDKVLKFIFQVPERFGSDVKVELPVTFNVDNYPGREFSGKVYLISPMVTTASRAFNVGALVRNEDLALKASTFARGKLVLGPGAPVPAVPLEAVISYAGVTKVFVANGTHAEARQVTVGRMRGGVQEILTGLKEGESVVTSGQGKLVEGSAVQIIQPGKN